MSRPAIDEKEIEAVAAAMRSGWIFPGMADADVDCVRGAVREILAEAGA